MCAAISALALQEEFVLCASLGAFGGFLDRKFRERDYQFGRRNCQRFLQVHFLLPRDNSTIGPGLIKTDGEAQKEVNAFRKDPPPGVTTDRDKDCFPIIPLMPSLQGAVTLPPREEFQTTEERIAEIARLAGLRIEAVVEAFLDTPQPHPLLKIWPCKNKKLDPKLSDRSARQDRSDQDTALVRMNPPCGWAYFQREHSLCGYAARAEPTSARAA